MGRPPRFARAALLAVLPTLPAAAHAQTALAASRAPSATARADAARPGPPAPPLLVVVLTVDQMRADYLVRFRSQFTGGLARLLREGAWFTDAYQDHAMTETAVGHATILSGRNPASHGIIDNAQGVGDPDEPLIGARGPGASPWRFRGTALFDWLAARSPRSRMLSVSRKDRGAILPVGSARQMVYWYAGGPFTTSSYYADSLPSWVTAFNARAIPVRAAGRAWEPLLPADSYPEPDAMPWEYGGANIAFPHQLPADTTLAKAWFVLMPWMDQYTLDFALAGVRATRLGRGPAADVLAVSLSTTDAIGHAWGPASREIHDQMLRLDRELGSFLDALGRLRDPRRTVVVLTADHGVTPFAAWARQNGYPLAENVSLDSLVRAAYDSLIARAGPGPWVRFWDLGLLALDRPGLIAHHVNVDSAVGALAAAILRRSGAVLRVDTRATLARADTAADAIARRWIKTIPPDLGAELMVTLQPMSSFGSARSAQHGQPSDDDAHVPLLFWGAGIRPGTYGERVSVTDIAPTLAALLGVRPLEPVQGRVLTEALARR